MTDIKPANRLNAALAALQTDLPVIAKDQTANAGTYKYKYADLADVSQAIMPLLGKHGLAFTARPTLHDGRFVLMYELRHESGEEIAGVYPLPERGSPQEIGGQITYARRYCLCAVTGVAPADDDDDAATAQRASQRRQRREDRQGQQAGSDTPRITSQQQREMQELFNTLGTTNKAERLRFAATAAKRELRSATELTQAEADRVLATLKQAVEKKTAKDMPGKPADPEADPEGWVASQEPPAGHQGVPAR